MKLKQSIKQFSIPSNAAGVLSFQLNVVSNETTTVRQFDKLIVELYSPTGTLWATLGTFSNLDRSALGSYSLKTFDLLSFKGKAVRIQFRVVTDGSTSTTFRVDNVSVK